MGRTTMTDLRQNNGKSLQCKKAQKRQIKFHINKKELRNLYWNQQLDLYEIAKQYHISPATVFNWMKKYNIPTRSKTQAATLMYTKHPEIREKHRENANNGITGVFIKGKNYSNTRIEMIFSNWCDHNNIKYERQFKINNKGHRYDFLLPPKQIVEIDGEYWHNTTKQKEKDQIQENFARSNEYDIIRFTDKEMKQTKCSCFNILLEDINDICKYDNR